MQLNYKNYGETGPIIVIIHGIFGSLDNWHTVAKELGKSYQVYTLDMRNHGHSPHSDEMSIQLMVEDVVSFCATKSLDRINLIGHSMGGKVAMALADGYTGLLDKLIIVDIAPKDYKAGHNPYFKAYEEIDLSGVKNRKELDAAFLEYEAHFGVRQFLMKNVVSNSKGGYQLKIHVQGIKNGYEEIIGGLDLGMIETPTLFIKGANSNYIKDEDTPLLNEYFSDYEMESIANSGHWVHAENKDGFIEVLLKFIRE